MYSDVPRRRRKSSFAALYKTIIIDNDETLRGDQVNSSSIEPSTREEIVKNRISLWDKEIEDWKKKAHEMKFKHTSKMTQVDHILTWKDCKDCLTPEDFDIIKGKSNCDKLAKKVLELDESRKIVDGLLEKNDVKVNAFLKKKCASISEMKKDFCNFLLHCEESNE